MTTIKANGWRWPIRFLWWYNFLRFAWCNSWFNRLLVLVLASAQFPHSFHQFNLRLFWSELLVLTLHFFYGNQYISKYNAEIHNYLFKIYLDKCIFIYEKLDLILSMRIHYQRTCHFISPLNNSCFVVTTTWLTSNIRLLYLLLTQLEVCSHEKFRHFYCLPHVQPSVWMKPQRCRIILLSMGTQRVNYSKRLTEAHWLSDVNQTSDL